MVIDDDNIIRAALEAALEDRYAFVGHSTGEEALKSIVSCDPDLLILDVQLPGSDGFEICEKVRSKAGLRSLPILFMTVRNDDKTFLKTLYSGGNSIITKPFEIAELRKRVEELLRGFQSA